MNSEIFMVKLNIVNHKIYRIVTPIQNLVLIFFFIFLLSLSFSVFFSKEVFAIAFLGVVFSLFLYLIMFPLLLIKLKEGYIEIHESKILLVDSENNIEFKESYNAILTFNIQKFDWQDYKVDINKIYNWNNKIEIQDLINNVDFNMSIYISDHDKEKIFLIKNSSFTLNSINNRPYLFTKPLEIIKDFLPFFENA